MNGTEHKKMKDQTISNKPLLSVCITTYNHEPYIAQALDSVLAQVTDFNFEIIIGEDDSSDGTRAICIEYAEKYPDKISLFLNDRKNVIYIDGIATGRWNFINNIKHAQGKYIAMLEGDDYWTDALKLKKQVDMLEKNTDATGCFHETQSVMLNRELGKVYGKTHKSILTAEDTITKYSPFHTSSFMFRRKFLPDPVPEWFKKVISGDMALFMILANRGELISIPEVMSIYRKHPGGMTETSVVQQGMHDHRIKLMEYFNAYTKGKYKNKINKIIKEHKKEKVKIRTKKVNVVTNRFLSKIFVR